MRFNIIQFAVSPAFRDNINSHKTLLKGRCHTDHLFSRKRWCEQKAAKWKTHLPQSCLCLYDLQQPQQWHNRMKYQRCAFCNSLLDYSSFNAAKPSQQHLLTHCKHFSAIWVSFPVSCVLLHCFPCSHDAFSPSKAIIKKTLCKRSISFL